MLGFSPTQPVEQCALGLLLARGELTHRANSGTRQTPRAMADPVSRSPEYYLCRSAVKRSWHSKGAAAILPRYANPDPGGLHSSGYSQLRGFPVAGWVCQFLYFGVMGGIASPTARSYLHSPTGASP